MSITAITPGQKYNSLIVLKRVDRIGVKRHPLFEVKCSACGREFTAFADNIRRHSRSSSRGCIKCWHRNYKHGMSHCQEYKVWEGMVRRCYSQKHEHYKNYGGRGITVCQEWKDDAKSFISWLRGNNWKHGLDIDRIDNNGMYSPENCRITTRKENNRNKRKNRRSWVRGEFLALCEVSEKYGIKYTTLRYRLNAGMEGESLISEVRSYGR